MVDYMLVPCSVLGLTVSVHATKTPWTASAELLCFFPAFYFLHQAWVLGFSHVSSFPGSMIDN